jgi:hypothetical protein
VTARSDFPPASRTSVTVLAWVTAVAAVIGPTAMTLWLEVELRRAGTSLEALTGEPMVPSLIWVTAWIGYPIVGARPSSASLARSGPAG